MSVSVPEPSAFGRTNTGPETLRVTDLPATALVSASLSVPVRMTLPSLKMVSVWLLARTVTATGKPQIDESIV